MNHVERLATAVDRLERQIRRREGALVAEIDTYSLGLTADDMVDGNGRPILADLQAALVNGLAALTIAGRTS